MGSRTQVSKERQRGYQLQDGNGKVVPGVDIEIIYSEDPAPEDPASSDNHWVKVWDNDLQTTSIITPHVEAAPPVETI